MKNKYKFMLAMLIGSVFTISAVAQGPFVNIHAGYAFCMAPANLPGFYHHTNGDNFHSYEQVNVSLSRGLNAGVDIGTMLDEHIGIQLGFNFLGGARSRATLVEPNGHTDMTIWSNMMMVTPAIILATNAGKLKPYGRFGVIFGRGAIHRINDEIDGNDRIYTRTVSDGGIAVGLNSAIGVMAGIGTRMSLFVELSMVNMSYAPKTTRVTEMTVNGADGLPFMTTREKQTDYYREYSRNDNPPDYEPTKALKQSMPYSSLGINIGLNIPF